MKISRIAVQEKRRDRYSIFVDGTYAFSLSEPALLESKLVSGQELTSKELQNWKRESAEDKLYMNALRYVAMRSRSEWEIRTYLERKKASPPLTELIVNKLTKIGLLNDKKFAQSWISSRRLLRPTSKRKLQQELRVKHVGEDIIIDALQEEATDERAQLRELIAKKRTLLKYRTDKVKLMQYLSRQGFAYGDIKDVLNIEEDA